MDPVVTPQQLHLNVSLRDEATLDNFYVPPGSKNAEILTTLQQQLTAVDGSVLYLWGASGCGLSHLLQGACHQMQGQARRAIYLPVQDLAGYEPQALLDGLEFQDLVCLDGLHCVVGKPQWERCLFDLYNRIKEQRHHLIVAASTGPHQLAIRLADLQSRLSAGYSYQVEALTDQDKLAALQQRARGRGMEMSEEVAQFILNRAPRDMSDLFCILEQLDDLTLSAQRRLTIPFVKQVMAW